MSNLKNIETLLLGKSNLLQEDNEELQTDNKNTTSNLGSIEEEADNVLLIAPIPDTSVSKPISSSNITISTEEEESTDPTGYLVGCNEHTKI